MERSPPDEQVLLSLVEYLPVRAVQSLSLVDKRRLTGRESTGIIKQKYTKSGSELYTDQETKTLELVDAIERDDLHTVEHILAYTDSDILVSYVLRLAATYHSRRVFVGVAPMLTEALDDMLTDDNTEDEDLWNVLYDLTVLTLKTDDPVFYEAFLSAVENTTAGVNNLLIGGVIGPDIIGDFAWFSYLGVVTGQDTGAYAVLKKYIGNWATPTDDLMNAFEQIQTPAMIKYLVESGQYDENLPYQIENPYPGYASGEMSYEDVLEMDAKSRQAGLDLLVSKMFEERLP